MAARSPGVAPRKGAVPPPGTDLPPLLAPFGGTKILAVGRNYRPHAAELGNAVPEEPIWFYKPPSALIGHQGVVRLPAGVGQIDYEGELALVIGATCRHTPASEALSKVAGVTLALDVTARQLQKKEPQWTRAKGFDTFCPLGPWIARFTPSWLEARLETRLNGKTVQSDQLTSLIFPVPELIAHISRAMTLEPGDVILTGTPAGVGPLVPGDRVEVRAEGPVTLSLEISCAAET
ncbi:MAG: fumarylacetoacetate hydrolase family protein [Candidatus Riflebacteria bacterium]|nr:fumarylacetoacetate hydrolase family protein [Candidatus Riflebacteria bacterium]